MHAEQANPLAAGKDDVNPLNMVCRHKIQYTKVKIAKYDDSNTSIETVDLSRHAKLSKIA